MRKSVHELTMEQAFGIGARTPVRGTGEHVEGGQPYRRDLEQRRERDVEQEEIEAARAWLAHVQAGRIGGSQ